MLRFDNIHILTHNKGCDGLYLLNKTKTTAKVAQVKSTSLFMLLLQSFDVMRQGRHPPTWPSCATFSVNHLSAALPAIPPQTCFTQLSTLLSVTSLHRKVFIPLVLPPLLPSQPCANAPRTCYIKE